MSDRVENQLRLDESALLSEKVVIIWNNLSHYHLARALGAARVLGRVGLEVIAVQLAGREATRDWRTDVQQSAVQVETVRGDVELGGSDVSVSNELIQLLDKINPGVVVVAGYDRVEMRKAVKWSKSKNRKLIVMTETKWDDKKRGWLRRAVASHYLAKSDAVLVSGAPSGEYAISLGYPREKVFTHAGAIDNEFFSSVASSVRGERHLEGHSQYFIVCGRMIEERKNMGFAIHSYAKYRDLVSSEPWDLRICGDGVDRGVLEGIVADNKIEGVYFEGFLQAEGLARKYAKAGAFIHPAINEAWGLVVNEAMASSLPVLVSRRVGSAYDLVHHEENGFLFDPYSREELVRYMVLLSEMPPADRERMGRSSKAIVSRFGPDAFGEGLLNAINCSLRRV